MSHRHHHIDTERMQALLDGVLPREEARVLRAEVDGCPRCSAEFEAWAALFDDLSELPVLAPSVHFGDRVMQELPKPARRPLLAGLFGRRDATEHAGSGELQEYLDGRLAARTSIRLEEHLEGCPACRSELDGLHQVVHRLDTLPELAPSADFAEGVMAAVRVQLQARMAMAPTSRWERAVRWARGLVPSSSRGWAAALGAGTAPAVTLALVLQTVFSHELVTVGNLLAFLSFKLSGLWESALGFVPRGVFDNAFVAWAESMAQLLGSSPSLLAAVAVGISGTCLGAAWVLYRNLAIPAVDEGSYARLSH